MFRAPFFSSQPSKPVRAARRASRSPAAAAAARDARVRDALADLSEEQRETVRLAFFSGLTQTEIAEAQNAPLGTVKSRLRLAFKRLRAALGDDFQMELHDD